MLTNENTSFVLNRDPLCPSKKHWGLEASPRENSVRFTSFPKHMATVRLSVRLSVHPSEPTASHCSSAPISRLQSQTAIRAIKGAAAQLEAI